MQEKVHGQNRQISDPENVHSASTPHLQCSSGFFVINKNIISVVYYRLHTIVMSS